MEILEGSTSQSRREVIKEAFNAGICKIIIGTATIREGINLQKNGTVIYNLYPDWNPTDIQQLEGRVWRQGNKFGYVRVVLPLVQDSMDVFVFQKIEEKTSRINDIWYRGDRGNVLSLESLDPEEVKYALLTDIEAIAKTIINKEVDKQKRKIDGIEYNVDKLKDFTYNYNRLNNRRESLKKVIDNAMLNFSQIDYIAKKPTKKELKAFDVDKRKSVARHIEKYEQLKDTLSKIPIEDKELLKVGRSLANLFSYVNTWDMTLFAEYLSKVKKAEKTILQPKGFTIDDDINKVIAEYKKDLEIEQKDLAFLQGNEHKKNVLKEVQHKKSAMQIEGKDIYGRVKEFSDLNYLLSYKFGETQIDSCPLPGKESTKKKVKSITYKKKNKSEDEALALAIALQLQLELLEI